MPHRWRRSIAAASTSAFAVALGLTMPTASTASTRALMAASASDNAIVARDILPSGEYGTLPAPAGALTQALMYDALTPLGGHVTAADLLRDFKPEPLNSASAPRPVRNEVVPHAGLTILRDAFNTPYIHGTTRDNVTWGAGWVTAEDRSLLLLQARYDSVVAALDVPGQSAFDLITSLQNFVPSAQAERELAKQTTVLQAAGAKGRAVLHDIDVYLTGINAYFAATHQNVAPFTRNDIYAFNGLKDQFVGEGGGDQLRRAQLLASLERKLGRVRGTAVYDDLREANDPETPSSLPGHVTMLPPPRSTNGNIIPDAGSAFAPADPLAPAADPHAADHAKAAASLIPADTVSAEASNVLMVSAARSSTHHPIMVAGPQIGYEYPGFILEMALDGPGVHVRGATSAPFPGYIFIGRNSSSAWTLTSAELPQVDTYVETLCGQGTHSYRFRGKCLRMSLFDAGTLGGKAVTFYRTVHGPVIGYARVHGRLVAISRKRSSYGKDILDQLFYRDLTDGAVHNVQQFYRAANQTPQTFNSFYIDAKHIAAFTSGLVPVRPRNADPDLPIDGRGGEEWRGYYGLAAHPHGADPASGEIVNWNNRLQAGYEAPSENWALGAVHRVELLLQALGHGRNLTPARITGAMNQAASQDVRQATFEPVLSALLRTGRAPSAFDGRLIGLLDAWHRHGSSRLDRTGNGQISDPGAALMDVAWPVMTNAWASSVLDASLRGQLDAIQPRYDYPFSGPAQPNGREQTKGWFAYMDKDLRTIMGRHVAGRFRVRYCGRGNLSRCRTLLWRALDQAGRRLASSQGADPSRWRESAIPERISFLPGLLHAPGASAPFTIRYTNRPSGIQQILSFR